MRCLQLHDDSKSGVALRERFDKQRQKEKKQEQRQEAEKRARQEARRIAEEQETIARISAAKKEVVKLIH